MRLLLLREVLDNDFLEAKVLMANGPLLKILLVGCQDRRFGFIESISHGWDSTRDTGDVC